MNAPVHRVLRSPLAGHWYPADAVLLRAEIRAFLERVKDTPPKHPMGLILPHAGYRYSGFTAAHGVRAAAAGSHRRVVLLGPSHRWPLPNRCALPEATHFATPLGAMPLDTAWLERLEDGRDFQRTERAFEGENSIDLQIPLLQEGLGACRLAPLVVGQLDLAATRRLAARIAAQLDKDTLVIASSDFTHYGNDYGYVPFRRNIETNLRHLDLGAYEQIAANDLDGFYAYVDRTHATICGRSPIGLLLAMLPPQAPWTLLHYTTSGRLSGDFSMSCSYLAAAVSGRWPADRELRMPQAGTALFSDADREGLLAMARAALAFRLRTGRAPTLQDLGRPVTPAMRHVMGAFVSLHADGQLRGCIGEIFPQRAVIEAVVEHAINAAFEDPRFPPLKRGELSELQLEISALHPPRAIGNWREIKIGRHGVVLEKHGRSAVFLPQVACEQGWDVETTLQHLALKAGLAPDAWRRGCSLSVFEAEVFSAPAGGQDRLQAGATPQDGA